MATKENFLKALKEARKQEETRHKQRGFDQTIDLIINLKDFDLRKNQISAFVTVPHLFKERKVAAFLEKKSGVVDTVTRLEFDSFSDKKKLKQLLKEYDFFIANAKLMPAVATSFGRVLGPVGKMPSPQLGILPNEEEATIKAMLTKINSIIRIRPKETDIKAPVGKQSLKDEEIADNAVAIYNAIFAQLPRKRDNLKSILIKFTMGKPIKVAF